MLGRSGRSRRWGEIKRRGVWQQLSAWLHSNKIFFEVLSYAVMPTLAVAVAAMQYRIMLAQTDLQHRQLSLQSPPTIEVESDRERSTTMGSDGLDPYLEIAISSRGGPAYINDIELLAFADLAYGNGTDSTCSYLVPVEGFRTQVYDTGHSEGLLANVTISTLDWRRELDAFVATFSKPDYEFVKLFPVHLLKVGYSDTQGTNRSVQYYFRANRPPQRIGSMIWARSESLHQSRTRSGFSVSARTRGAATKLVALFRNSVTAHAKHCRAIDLHLDGDLRGVLLD